MTQFPVVHFEMPYDDPERVSGFYAEAFGWEMQGAAAQADYVNAFTTETVDWRPTTPGVINGGFFPRKPEWPGQAPSVVIGVDDIAAAMERVTAAGGSVLGEPMQIPGIGLYVSFTDTEGNRVSILQPGA